MSKVEPLLSKEELSKALDNISKMTPEELSKSIEDSSRILKEAGIDIDNLISQQKPLDPEFSKLLHENVSELYID